MCQARASLEVRGGPLAVPGGPALTAGAETLALDAERSDPTAVERRVKAEGVVRQRCAWLDRQLTTAHDKQPGWGVDNGARSGCTPYSGLGR